MSSGGKVVEVSDSRDYCVGCEQPARLLRIEDKKSRVSFVVTCSNCGYYREVLSG